MSQRIRKHYCKTFGTSVRNSPMLLPSWVHACLRKEVCLKYSFTPMTTILNSCSVRIWLTSQRSFSFKTFYYTTTCVNYYSCTFQFNTLFLLALLLLYTGCLKSIYITSILQSVPKTMYNKTYVDYYNCTFKFNKFNFSITIVVYRVS